MLEIKKNLKSKVDNMNPEEPFPLITEMEFF